MTDTTTGASLEIKTNGRAQDLVCVADLPLKDQLDFPYIADVHQNRLVLYRGVWHDVLDTQVIEITSTRPVGWAIVVAPDHPFAKWHAISSDTYFSGTLFRLTGDEQVVCATYFSRG